MIRYISDNFYSWQGEKKEKILSNSKQKIEVDAAGFHSENFPPFMSD